MKFYHFNIILTIWLVLTSLSVFSQRMSLRTFNQKDGLPGMEYNNVLIHPNGKVYAFSSRMISEFDGMHVENISLDTVQIYSYPEHVILTASDKIFMTQGYERAIIFDPENRSFKKVLPYKMEDKFLIFPFKEDVYMCGESGELYKLNEATSSFDTSGTSELKSIYKSIQGPVKKSIYQLNPAGLAVIAEIDSSNYYNFFFKGQHVRFSVDIYQYPFVFNDKLFLFKPKKNGFTIYENGRSWELEIDGLEVYNLDLNIHYLLNDNEIMLGFWSQDEEGEIHWIKMDSSLQFKTVGTMPKMKLSTFAFDELQSIWTGGHTGLLKFNPKIQFFPSGENQVPRALHAFGEWRGKIFLAGYYKHLASYDGKEMKKEFSDNYGFLPGSYSMADKGLLFNCERVNGTILVGSDSTILLPFYMDGKPTNANAYFIDTLSDGSLWFGLQNFGLGRMIDISKDRINLENIGTEKGNGLINVLTFCEDRNKRIWMGRSSQGVAVYDPKLDTSYTYFISPDDNASFGAISSDIDTAGNLWLGGHNGLYFMKDPYEFDITGDDFFKKIEKIELPNGDTSVVTFLKQIDDYLVFGNQSAVSFIPLGEWYENKKTTPIYQLYYGEDIEGSGSEQNMILKDSEGYLWFGSQLGASRMDLSNFVFDTTQNLMTIRKIVNGKNALELENGETLKLPNDNRNFSLYFGIKDNKSLLRNVFYHYFLTNSDGDTLVLKRFDQNGIIELAYLPPGEYNLLIISNKYGLEMERRTIRVHVPYAFFENPWIIYGIGGIIFCLVTIGIVDRTIKKKKSAQKDLKLEKIAREKDRMHLQSILSSFNPHFINNSLHWVQSRYRKDEETVKVIGRLSQNIRYIFNNTRKGQASHTLKDELVLVSNYITIQQIRFDNSFVYKGPTEVELEKYKTFQIPILQLQIHFENAIEHGLRNRLNSTFVSLGIEDQGEYLLFVITDDGCGREEASKFESQGMHTGTKMLKDLHNMFNQKAENSLKIMSWYEDGLYQDEKGKKYGTKVFIFIPKRFSYII